MSKRAAARGITANSSFVGRSEELIAVSAVLDAAAQGRSAGLFVLGDPGIGKSRLLLEAQRIAAEREIRTASARCLPLTAPLPLDPVLVLLRVLGVPLKANARESPRELFWTVLERLEQASVERPLLLCLDDLQWSDAATLDMVLYCLARLSDLPLAWLLAARSGRSQSRVAHLLERRGSLGRLALSSLSPSETVLLAESLLGRSDVSQDLIAELYGRTGGNPFLCVELLRGADGSHRARAGGTPPGWVSAPVPATIKDAVEERAARLSPSAQVALNWAALLPEPFSFEELKAVGGFELGGAPEELADDGFLLAHGNGGWSFSHSIVRDAVYRQLSAGERVRRHGVVADALAARPLERLAPQLERACRWVEAAEAYVGLGESALNSGQGGDAGKLFDHAEQLATRGDNQLLRRRARVGSVLALVHTSAADLLAAEAARREAATLRSEMRASATPDERLRFLSRYALDLLTLHSDVAEARGALEEAEPLMQGADEATLTTALVARAWVSMRSGEPARALADAEAAWKLSDDRGDPELDARVLNSLGLAVGMARAPDEGVEILERAAVRALGADLPTDVVRAYLNASYLDTLSGDNRAAREHLQRALPIEGAPPSLVATLRGNMAFLDGVTGKLDSALAHALAALRVADRAGPWSRTRTACSLAYIHLWRGEFAAVERSLLKYAPLDANPADADPRSHEVWGMLLEERGAPSDALVAYRRGAALEDPISINCQLGVARSAVRVGDLPAARAACARVDSLAAQWPAGLWMRAEARAWVTLGEERNDAAITDFRKAAQISARAYDAARLRLEANRLAGAREGLLASIDEFDRMGGGHTADRARAIARSLGIRPGRRPAAGGALSAREQEIARFVAVGRTNAEIAADLFLSVRTVERHVASILTKLGYRSRVQIAADVARGHLPGSKTSAVPQAQPETP